ncbi:MAG TPA: hypothetical protein VMU12_01595 [Candidatus Paceibacterota bacterium]|nr:hypothetical protein [Candidatus Paceibacterota bacterium]
MQSWETSVRRYDSKCKEWDGFYFLGDSPTGAAYRHPGSWQLVYELRPLELIPFWLGIPFRPCHPLYAVIYDDDCPAYYTAPAAMVAELGKPVRVPGALPFARLWDVGVVVDRFIRLVGNAFSYRFNVRRPA